MPKKRKHSGTTSKPIDSDAVLPREEPLPSIHDAFHQAGLLRQALQSDKSRIGFLLGAGCPLGIFDEVGNASVMHIPDVAGLTESIEKKLSEADKDKATELKLVPLWKKLINSCTEDDRIDPNVEDLLSELRTLCGRRGKSDVDGMSKARLTELDQVVCRLITEEVGKPLPGYRCSYDRFASWVGNLNRIAPVELFTPNYDLLIEEAFEKQRIPHFDGFVGSREPFFDLASIEQDAIPKRWTRLWKLHGSINWQIRDDGTVYRVAGKAVGGKAMIYPSHLKYDQSRRMPYLAMLDRLKAFFRGRDHGDSLGPPVLVVCGYSFADDHLNELLLDGLRGNRGAQCFVLAYDALEKSQPLVQLAATQPNLTVLAWNGAVAGTRVGLYRTQDSVSGAGPPWIQTEPQIGCRLGDFHYFGLFLEDLCGSQFHEPTQSIS